jgi:hypothetical protein
MTARIGRTRRLISWRDPEHSWLPLALFKSATFSNRENAFDF